MIGNVHDRYAWDLPYSSLEISIACGCNITLEELIYIQPFLTLTDLMRADAINNAVIGVCPFMLAWQSLLD